MNQERDKHSTLQNRVGIIMLVIICIWFASRLWSDPLLQVDTIAPVWKLPLADGSGKMLRLEDLRGKAVVLDFWSTTCAPCRRQMEELDAIWRELEQKGAVIIGIAAGGEDVSEIVEFKKNKRIPYPLVVDSGTAAHAYKVRSLPTLYVLDKQGKIAAAHGGLWDRRDIVRAVTSALAAP
ncbi:MAG: TlpA family protein disulfide reductase [Deltaproteobacteria bacterium]|nr:TlpA family protein disulfide reductase [Deltaproteobacteria bacterium]